MPEVEELCNRVAIIRRGRVAYEGSLSELRSRAGISYRLRTTDDVRARAGLRGQPGIEEVEEGRPDGLVFKAADESAVGALSLALARVRRAGARADPAPGDPRGPLLRAHRGRRRAARAGRSGRRSTDGGAGLMPGVAHRLSLGAAQAPCAEAHLSRLRRGRRRADHLRGRAGRTGRRPPERRRLRPLRPRDGAGDSARAAPLRLGLALPPDHRAGGRGHHLLRGPQRDR